MKTSRRCYWLHVPVKNFWFKTTILTFIFDKHLWVNSSWNLPFCVKCLDKIQDRMFQDELSTMILRHLNFLLGLRTWLSSFALFLLMMLTLISSSVSVESVSFDKNVDDVFDFRFDAELWWRFDVLAATMFSLLLVTFCLWGDRLSSVVSATSFSAETIGWGR